MVRMRPRTGYHHLARRHHAEDLVGPELGGGQELLDELGGGRHHRQAVGPALLVVVLEQLRVALVLMARRMQRAHDVIFAPIRLASGGDATRGGRLVDAGLRGQPLEQLVAQESHAPSTGEPMARDAAFAHHAPEVLHVHLEQLGRQRGGEHRRELRTVGDGHVVLETRACTHCRHPAQPGKPPRTHARRAHNATRRTSPPSRAVRFAGIDRNLRIMT